MLAVGLTGGIGSGKSAVADLLVVRGAVLIDADQVARDVVAPGGPAYQPLVDRFGPGILDADGTIDRKALAAVAFANEESRLELNAITHPAIGSAMIQARDALAGTDDIVLLAIPLLTAAHRDTVKLHKIVVVDCPTDVALERLTSQRGFDRADAEARSRAQQHSQRCPQHSPTKRAVYQDCRFFGFHGLCVLAWLGVGLDLVSGR